jgi:hypothetical protein
MLQVPHLLYVLAPVYIIIGVVVVAAFACTGILAQIAKEITLPRPPNQPAWANDTSRRPCRASAIRCAACPSHKGGVAFLSSSRSSASQISTR